MTTLINNIGLFLSSDLITFILSSFWILSFSLIICFFFNKEIKDTVVLSFITSFILLFFGGLIGNILSFFIIGWIIIVAFYSYVFFRKKIIGLLKTIDIKFIIVYLCLSLIVFIYYQNAGFRFTDEFMHWGPMVKEMFRINKFYCSSESMLLVHKDYPPFFSLIELLFCMFGRGYAEKYLYIGLVSFAISIYISLSFNSKNKYLSLLGLIIIGFTFQYIPSIQDNTSIYNSVYIDYVLSLLFVYTICCLIKIDQYDDFNNKELALCFTALLMSKQIGVLYFGICVVYMLFFIKKKNRKYPICLLMPIVFYLIWKIIILTNGINGQFSLSNFSLRNEAISILKMFLDAIVSKPLFINPTHINTLFSFIITTAALFIVDKTNNKKITITYGIGFVLYLGVICLLYMFVFSVEEALTLSSFERYIISYVYIGFALITVCVCDSDNTIKQVVYMLLVILLCDLGNANINKIIDRKNILVINQQNADVEFNFYQTTGSVYSFDECPYLNENEIDKFKTIVKDYDYVYVYLYDDPFYKIWCDLTDDHSLENDSLFYKESDNPLVLNNSNFNTIYYVIKYCIKEN